MKDPYKILGINKNSSMDEIKKSYRKLAMKYHPDKNPGNKVAEDKFKEASSAYALLSDPSKRETFDKFGTDAAYDAFKKEGFNKNPFGDSDFFKSQQRPFHDVFSEMMSDFFGFSDNQPQYDVNIGTNANNLFQTRGQDLNYDLKLSLYEIIKPLKKRIRFSKQKANGSYEDTNILVNIPQGVHEGQKLKLSGQGDLGKGGAEPGDLYIRISYLEDPFFRRIDDDIEMDLPISFVDAALGAKVEVPVIRGGTIMVNIPSGTKNTQVLRVKNQGFSSSRGKFGSLLINIVIDNPDTLNKETRSLLLKIKDTGARFTKVEEYLNKLKELKKS